MKLITYLILSLFILSGCQNKIYRTYPDCADYYAFITGSMEKYDNSFYKVKEIRDTSEFPEIHFLTGPRFQRQWDEHAKKCLPQLSKKEVHRIFGKPSKIHKTYNPKIDEMLETHVYYISDSLCPDTNARESVNICSYISFIFRKGEQDKKYGRKPWLRLHNEYF